MPIAVTHTNPLSDFWTYVFSTVCFLQGVIWAANTPTEQIEIDQNPHGDTASCLVCHVSTDINEPLLKAGGDTVRLCRSCHRNDEAIHKLHPVGNVSQSPVLKEIPPSFPVHDGQLTCLSCHDVIPQCRQTNETAESNPSLLRQAGHESASTLCAHCHTEQPKVALNVHDQLQADRINTNTCHWCHVPLDNETPLQPDTVTYPVRKNASEICNNCHSVAQDHPTGGPHVHVSPSEDMLWYISAYELHTHMNLPIPELIVFVRAAQRTPRTLPLDDQGRITCATCHNPHEAGLFRPDSDRSIGAEPDHAVNHRLRAPKGRMCLTCHQM